MIKDFEKEFHSTLTDFRGLCHIEDKVDSVGRRRYLKISKGGEERTVEIPWKILTVELFQQAHELVIEKINELIRDFDTDFRIELYSLESSNNCRITYDFTFLGAKRYLKIGRTHSLVGDYVIEGLVEDVIIEIPWRILTTESFKQAYKSVLEAIIKLNDNEKSKVESIVRSRAKLSADGEAFIQSLIVSAKNND